MKVSPKKSQRGAGGETPHRQRESRKEEPKDDADAPLPMLQLDDDIESELPIRGRPSKKLLLQKQQQRAQNNGKLQPELKAVSTAGAVSLPGAGRSRAKRSLYRKGGSNSASQKTHSESYVMRLFERSLDLSKYKEKTPLYPICRAWMANQPRNPNVAFYNTDGSVPTVKREDDAEEVLAKLKCGDIKVLKEMPQARKTDMSPIPPRMEPGQEDKKLQGAKKEELLAANLTHWKRVRTHWLKHAHNYERERYEIIDQIMDAVCKHG